MTIETTAREQLDAAQEAKSRQIPDRDNALKHVLLYLTDPGARDQQYAADMRALGVAGSPQDVPHFRAWYDYMPYESGETREVREQYELAMSGRFAPADIPLVARWLEEVGPAMDAMHDVAALPHFWHPHDTSQTLLRNTGQLRFVSIAVADLIEAYRVRALYYLSVGDAEGAAADGIAADRFAKLMMQCSDFSVQGDASSAIWQNAELLARLLGSGILADAQLTRLAEQWADPPRAPSPAEIFDRWERLWLVDYFERVASGEETEPAFFLVQCVYRDAGPSDEEVAGWDWMMRHKLLDTDRAIRRVNDRYDELVRTVADPDNVTDAIQRFYGAHGEPVGRMDVSAYEFVERLYHNKQVPAGTTAHQYTDQVVDGLLMWLIGANRAFDGSIEAYQNAALQRMGVTAIALARYRLVEGDYPQSLDDLVPRYIDQVPVDPFDGVAPIRYRPEADVSGFTLYWVGFDQTDQQGEGDDIDLTVSAGPRQDE